MHYEGHGIACSPYCTHCPQKICAWGLWLNCFLHCHHCPWEYSCKIAYANSGAVASGWPPTVWGLLHNSLLISKQDLGIGDFMSGQHDSLAFTLCINAHAFLKLGTWQTCTCCVKNYTAFECFCPCHSFSALSRAFAAHAVHSLMPVGQLIFHPVLDPSANMHFEKRDLLWHQAKRLLVARNFGSLLLTALAFLLRLTLRGLLRLVCCVLPVASVCDPAAILSRCALSYALLPVSMRPPASMYTCIVCSHK